MLAAVLYFQKVGLLEPAADSTISPTEAAVFGLDTGNIAQAQIEIPGGDRVVFILDQEGTWSASEPSDFQPDPDTINSALGQISTWTIQTELNIVPPMEAIGLSSPAYVLIIQMDTGQQHTIQVGSLNPAQTGYYLRVDGGSPFLVNRYSVEPVVELLDLLHITPTPPSEILTPDATVTP